VILDLSGVEFVDSSGISCLVGAQRRAESDRRRFGIVEGGNVRKVLQRYGLDELLMVGSTLEELLAGSDGSPAPPAGQPQP